MNQAKPSPRCVAIDALVRIESEGAFANLVVPKMLDRADFEPRDRGFVTELVYGSTRMRRALDFLIDRFLLRDDVEPLVRSALRVGAYQIAYLGTPPHAAVGETVASVPKRVRGIINAVLRKVAAEGLASERSDWPSIGIELSYPDWIVDRLVADLGETDAIEALRTMNQAASVATRDDGYRQDPSSQRVASLIESSGVVLDLCAAPGGKATALASPDRFVVAADIRPSRITLIATNRAELGQDAAMGIVAMDGTAPALAPNRIDAVLVDAPCSGLGALRRRPDARWRITPDAVERLIDIQYDLLCSALDLVKPGGEVVYSVCTLTNAESSAVVDRCLAERPDLQVIDDGLPAPWRSVGAGGRLLPQDEDGDGMYAVRLRRAL